MKTSLSPVFIHSSFRTGSTWIWSKFRENSECYCYYEIFNEALSVLDFQNISQSAGSWNSHHPSGPPYFAEFSPLLSDGKGVPGYDQDMALVDFCLESSGDNVRVEKLRAYLASLVELAQHNGRTPILSCTRSIGRVQTIRDLIGGTHILVKRRLLNQWFSYSNQIFYGNAFFINSTISVVNYLSNDKFVKILRNILHENDIFGYEDDSDPDILLIVFLSFHLYIYAKYINKFDYVIDFDKKSVSSESVRIEQEIKKLTSIEIDLSDYKEAITAPSKLIRDVDGVILMVRSIFAKGIAGVDDTWLREFVDSELADFQSGYENYIAIAGSAHQQIMREETMQRQRVADLESAAQAAASVRQSDAEQIVQLRAQLTEAAIQRDAAIQERAEAQTMFDETTIRADQRAAELLQEVESLRTERERLDQQLRENKAIASDMQTEMLTWRAKNAELEEDITRARMELAQLHAQMAESESRCDAAVQERAEVQANFDETNMRADKRAAELLQEIESLRAERERLDQQLRESEAIAGGMQTEMLTWRAKSVELEEAIACSSTQQALLQAQLTESESRRAAAEQMAAQEHINTSNAIARMNYVLDGHAEEDAEFERRWDAMIKRLK